MLNRVDCRRSDRGWEGYRIAVHANDDDSRKLETLCGVHRRQHDRRGSRVLGHVVLRVPPANTNVGQGALRSFEVTSGSPDNADACGLLVEPGLDLSGD